MPSNNFGFLERRGGVVQLIPISIISPPSPFPNPISHTLKHKFVVDRKIDFAFPIWMKKDRFDPFSEHKLDKWVTVKDVRHDKVLCRNYLGIPHYIMSSRITIPSIKSK